MLPILTILFGYQLFSIANELKNEILMKTYIKKKVKLDAEFAVISA